jgi:GNAT superfamily N-acetyltransferase
MIRQARPEEADEICRLILGSFEAKVAKDYSPEGIEFFHSISGAEDCAQRLRSGNPAWVHVDDAGAIDGYIELRDVHHVTRFFVAPHRMGEGIGKGLHEVAQAHCRGANLDKMTVFSSPFAVPVYARLGYVSTGEEQAPNGLRFVPMEKLLIP